jgi:phosphopantothenoylcysteine decarboxylase / phosphopantothenate---cysteine ligase
MLEACLIHSQQCDIFIACAAVADYRPQTCSEQKIKKEKGVDTLSLTLVKNPDIISQIAQQANKPFILGFAAETQNLLEHAKIKLENKGMDMIAANDVSREGIGFNSEQNAVTLIYRQRNVLHEENLKLSNKFNLACQIIAKVAQQLK